MKLYLLEIEETRTTRAYALAESKESAKQLGYDIDLDDYYAEPERDVVVYPYNEEFHQTAKEVRAQRGRPAIDAAALTECIEHTLPVSRDVQLRHALILAGLEDGELPEVLERFRPPKPPVMDESTLPLPGFDDIPVPQEKP